MKKSLKFAALLLSLVMAGSCFAACGSKNAETSDNKDGKTEEKQELVFGTNPEFAPFEFVSSGTGVIDQYDGIDIAIAKQIGEDNGMTSKIDSIEFDSLLIALNNGQVDAVIAGMTITDARKEEVDFSMPYYKATQVMIVHKDSDIKTAQDMKDKKIAVVQGYTGEECVKKLGFEYEAFKKGTEAILELVNGKCDVVVLDSATAQKYIEDQDDLMTVTDENAFESEEYGIAVKKGNTELLDKINASVEKMLNDGTIADLAIKYTEGEDVVEEAEEAVSEAIEEATDAIESVVGEASDAVESVVDNIVSDATSAAE